ncbi:MAG TPA: DUF5666 domain-containing protein [Candidatus Acidoferrum sp.]
MELANIAVPRRVFGISALLFNLLAGLATIAAASRPPLATPLPAQTPSIAKPVGTIKSISGNTITLTSDAGTDVTVQVQDATKFVRIVPGQTDLKSATPIQFQDVQAGDRILVRGKMADDGKSVLALSIIAMKKSDLAEKQAHEREEWQKHGTGGLVSSVDASAGTINISLPAIGEKKTVAIHLSKDTVLRRYAPDSVKFDDAKPAPLDQIKPGDQLRARGTRNADGSELAADEIVSGSFRNIAGIISAVDASAGSITVQDLATNKPVSIKITAESQLRKLPAPMAQRIAMRLKGVPSDAPAQGTAGPAATSAQAPKPAGPPAGGPGSGGPGGSGRPGGAGGGDLQQAILRVPAATLAELQKGGAVMIVATSGGPNDMPTAITVIGGVEPILEASPKSSASTILSPWSLGGAPGGEGATP